jgi:hypothetical protein
MLPACFPLNKRGDAMHSLRDKDRPVLARSVQVLQCDMPF